MKVEVHLHATLRMVIKEGKGQVIVMDLPENSTIGDLLEFMKIDQDPDHMLFVQNGRTAGLGQVLEDGDVLNLMTAVSGG
ncbi:MAG: MoaD/ThiS family protein [Anaerolineales bacterium]|nr:MoaD/ThiS family protein [Anaerolineales bacterium]